MAEDTLMENLALHKKFWEGSRLDKPLAAFRTGEYFFARHYRAARRLLQNEGTRITPDMIDVDAFMEDYERLYGEVASIGQTGVWTAEPYIALPWLEAMLGCEVFSTRNSFVTHPRVRSIGEIRNFGFDQENPWFLKYMEFLASLKKLSGGRFPVGQPIMRGPSDVMGAVLGQEQMVYALYDDPDEMKRFFLKTAEVHSQVIARHYSCVGEFMGGSSIGFYHVWCPGRCIWFQEDLSSLMTRQLYGEFLKEPDERICQGYDYTAIHLHCSSFFILDELLEIEKLKVIQVNKDVGGPSVADMLPVFRKILGKKKLIIWGELDEEDIDAIYGNLPNRDIFLSLLASDPDRAKSLMEHIYKKAEKEYGG